MTDSSALPRPATGRRRRLIYGICAALLACLLVLYLAGVAFAGDNIPRGVRVGSIDLGGKSQEQAVRLLQTGLGDRARQPIRLQAGEREYAVDPAKAGLSFDAEATARAAAEARMDPVSVFGRMVGATRQIEPRADVDQAALEAEMARVAKEVDRNSTEGVIKFTGTTPSAVPPKEGLKLEQDEAADAVRNAYLVRSGVVEAPTAPVPPKVSPQAVQEALEQIARPAVASPVALSVSGKPVTIPPADVAATLSFAATADGKLEPRIDGAALTKRLAKQLTPIQVQPKNARFTFSGGRPVIVPAVNGKAVVPNELAAAVQPQLAKPAPRAAAVAIKESEPETTTAELQKLGIVAPIGSFTTRHPCCAPRVQNIHRIADIVNGALVKPGETFSLNGFVGRRDRARGFVEAPMIEAGVFKDSVGGGVSQFATTLFNAYFFAGLDDVQHKPHSYYISRYPPGRESTVSYPEPDIRFRNDSPHGVLIQTGYTDTSITVTLWGTKRYDIDSETSGRYRITSIPPVEYNTASDCHSSSGATGFSIDVKRIFKQGGRVVKTENFHTVYSPQPPVICGPRPAPTPSASPPATVAGAAAR